MGKETKIILSLGIKMIKNSLKVVVLGIVGFFLLVYFTMPKNPNENRKMDNKNVLNIDFIPKYFEIIGNNSYVGSETYFSKGVEKYIIVLNHDSLALFRDLYKYTNKNIILVANISDTPWIIKQLAVDKKLEEMYKESKIPLINDSKGTFVNSLNLNDKTQNKYFIYKLKNDGNIEKIKENFVELNILEKGISDESLKNSLEEISKLF
jgi:hypothetical protein